MTESKISVIFLQISRKMFHLYWPVVGLVAAFVVVASVLMLMMGGRFCKGSCVRTSALPDRDLKTYLPETVTF